MKSLLSKVGVAATILTLTWVLGNQAGRSSSERQRAVDKAVLVQQNLQLQKDLDQKTEVFIKTRKELEDEILKTQSAYEQRLSDAGRDFAVRLRDSTARAGVYQRLSQASDAERANLADHAAQLDRSLEEGRHLVRELREALGQRDNEVIFLTRELFATRELMGIKHDAANHQP